MAGSRDLLRVKTKDTAMLVSTFHWLSIYLKDSIYSNTVYTAMLVFPLLLAIYLFERKGISFGGAVLTADNQIPLYPFLG